MLKNPYSDSFKYNKFACGEKGPRISTGVQSQNPNKKPTYKSYEKVYHHIAGSIYAFHVHFLREGFID